MDNKTAPQPPTASRLEQLNVQRGTTAENINHGYSNFIRKIKLALPITALLLIGVIIGWNNFEDDKIIPIKQEDVQPEVKREIGKNELVNPKFDSKDGKGQPFTITADSAIQENKDNGEMLLENPVGQLTLNNGDIISLKSNNGDYKQLEQYLDLHEDVVLTHSAGYTMETSVLHVDMKTEKAWSEEVVRVTGPQGSIDAQGVTALSKDEIIIFKGPTKMLINMNGDDAGFGDMLP